MPKPTLPEFEPRDISLIHNSLVLHWGYLAGKHKEAIKRRGYAFKNGEMEFEKELGERSKVYQDQLDQITKLLEVFKDVETEEFVFNEWL